MMPDDPDLRGPDDANLRGPDDANLRGPDDAEPTGRRPRGHPDIEALDAVAGGTGSRSAARHTAGCAECAEAVEALRQVRSRLADLAVVRMPDDVAARIGAALAGAQAPAAELDRDAVTARDADPAAELNPDPAAPGSGPTADGPTGVIPHPATRAPVRRRVPGPRRSRGRAAGPPREPLVARSLHAGGPSGRPDPRRTVPSGDHRVRRPGHDRAAGRILGGLAVCLLLVVAVTGVALFDHARRGGSGSSSASSADRTAAGRAPAVAPPVAGGTGRVSEAAVATSRFGLSAGNAERHAAELVAGRVPGSRRVGFAADGSVVATASAASAARSGAPEAASGGGPATSPDAPLLSSDLQGCYLSLIARFGGSIQGLDLVTYGGRPAAVVVLSVPGRPGSLRVVVLDPQCGGSTLAASLRFQTVSPAG